MRAFRGLFKKTRVVEGSMGVGYIIVDTDDCPLCSVNIPLADAKKSEVLANYICDMINRNLVSAAMGAES